MSRLQLPSSAPCSLPLPVDLMETCIDDVLRTPTVMAAAAAASTALDEAGPSGAFACAAAGASGASIAGDDPLSLSEAAARLKQLALDSSPLLATPRNNSVNINVALNNQEDVVKLTEKCGLNSSAGSGSPVATPRRTPEDLKSNILKAQAEAAALMSSLEDHVVTVGDKNCNLQEASGRLKVRTGRLGSNSSLSVGSRQPDVQESWEGPKPTSLFCSLGTSAERLADSPNTSLPMMLCEPAAEGLAPKAKAEEVDLSHPTVMSDNLIDFSDPTPALPPVQQPKAAITPRWIIPTSAPPGIFTNGLLDLDAPAKVNPPPPADGGPALTAALPNLPHLRNTLPTR